MIDLYLIAHIGHTTKSHEHIQWWKPDSRGYTVCIDKAGLYSADEAASICNNSHGVCIAVREADVKPLARTTPYYRLSNGTLGKLYDGDRHRPVPNSRGCWAALMACVVWPAGRTENPRPIGAKARAIYLDGATVAGGEG